MADESESIRTDSETDETLTNVEEQVTGETIKAPKSIFQINTIPIKVTCGLLLKQFKQMVLFGDSIRMVVVDLLTDIISINKHNIEYGGNVTP